MSYGARQGKKGLTVVFRYDDVSATNLTKVDRKILTAFHRLEAGVTFGVVPFPAGTHEKADDNQREHCGSILMPACASGGLEVALHGFSHGNAALSGAGNKTEFAGLGYSDQLDRVAKGKKVRIPERLGHRFRD